MNTTKITKNTKLKVIKEWNTPYERCCVNEYASVGYWAKSLGKSAEQFIIDIEDGKLDNYFKVVQD